jgi:alpha-glucosidase
VEGSTGRKNIDNTPVVQPEVRIHRTLETLPVFIRAGSIVPEQPLVQNTEEKPEGPLTLRVYPPAAQGTDCSGSLYLDDGVSYDFRKGAYLRAGFGCRVMPDGVIVTVTPREGSFQPWWQQFAVEVYGAARPAANASVTALDGKGAASVSTAFDSEHHRVTALVPDDGKGLELKVIY